MTLNCAFDSRVFFAVQLSTKILCTSIVFFFHLWYGTGCSWQRCAFLEEARFTNRRFVSNPEKKNMSESRGVLNHRSEAPHSSFVYLELRGRRSIHIRTARKIHRTFSTCRIHISDDQTREKVPRYPLAMSLRPNASNREIQHQGPWKINLAKLLAWIAL